MQWKSWIVYVLGGWLICFSLVNIGGLGQGVDDVVIGILAATVGFWLSSTKPWHGRIAGVSGIWLIIAALIPPLHAGTALYWNNILVGLVITSAGLLSFAVDEDAEIPWKAPL